MKPASRFQIARAILATPRVALAGPSLILFMCRYLNKFRVMDMDGELVVHSHLPPLNSRAYARFVSEHLLAASPGFSHAQIGVTNACPQRCGYCYNRDRAGRPMDTETILQTVRGLKAEGVFWIGLTGGEPLLNKDLPRIVDAIGPDCVSKLFTTGCTLTPGMALELKNAGLYSVSVSLDHWRPEEHDRVRNYPGAFQTALRAIETFLGAGGIQVGVSAVLSRAMMEPSTLEMYLEFLSKLGIHEAWLSEAKPSALAGGRVEPAITPDEHRRLVEFQDRYNRRGGMVFNYLGHFEDAAHFGCSAGHKMVYVDAFGDVSPCVFIPMNFGNVQKEPVGEICRRLRSCFPSESDCFINQNAGTLRALSEGRKPLGPEASARMLETHRFGPRARFFQLQYGRRESHG